MELRGNIIYPSRREYDATGLGCFAAAEAPAIADGLDGRSEEMIRDIRPGDMATFHAAANLRRIALSIRRYVPGLLEAGVDLSITSDVFDQQRKLGHPSGDGSFISDEELLTLSGQE